MSNKDKKAYPNKLLYTLSLAEQPDGRLVSCHGEVGREKVLSCRVSEVVFCEVSEMAAWHNMPRSALCSLLVMDSLYRLKLLHAINDETGKPIRPIVTDIELFKKDMDEALENIEPSCPKYGASRKEIEEWRRRNQ